jgi:hypothetical protein
MEIALASRDSALNCELMNTRKRSEMASMRSNLRIFCPDRGAFQSHRMCSRLIIGKHQMDAMMIGAPLGLGVLIAFGVLLAVTNHLSQ